MPTMFPDEWHRFRALLTVRGRVIWALNFRKMGTRFNRSKLG